MSTINEALRELRNLKEEINYIEDEYLIEQEENDLEDITEYIAEHFDGCTDYNWTFNPNSKKENTWSIYFVTDEDIDTEKRFKEFIEDEFGFDDTKFVFDNTNNYIWTSDSDIEVITGKEAKDRFTNIYCDDSAKVFVINLQPDLDID